MDQTRLGRSIKRARELVAAPSRDSERMARLLSRMQVQVGLTRPKCWFGRAGGWCWWTLLT